MKFHVTVDETLEIEDPDTGESFEDLLKEEATIIVREQIRDLLDKKAKASLQKWLKEEFGKNGGPQVRDGVVYIPLLLGDLNGESD